MLFLVSERPTQPCHRVPGASSPGHSHRGLSGVSIGTKWTLQNPEGQVSTHASATSRAQFHRLGSPWFVLHAGSLGEKHLSKVTFLFLIIFAGI